jgi:hypothetical protein
MYDRVLGGKDSAVTHNHCGAQPGGIRTMG